MGLLASPEELHGLPRIQLFQIWSRCLDETIQARWWLIVLLICVAVHRQLPRHLLQCRFNPTWRDWRTLGPQAMIYRSAQYLSWGAYSKINDEQRILGLGFFICPICQGCSEECGRVSHQASRFDSKTGRVSTIEWISSIYWHLRRTWSRQCALLTVSYWRPKIDGRSRMYLHMRGGINVIIVFVPSKERLPWAALSHLCVSEEASQRW